MRPRMSGSTCARTGSQTGSSLPTPTWSTIAVRLGTSSSTAPGSSCPLACASGLTGPNHRDLVLPCRKLGACGAARARARHLHRCGSGRSGARAGSDLVVLPRSQGVLPRAHGATARRAQGALRPDLPAAHRVRDARPSPGTAARQQGAAADGASEARRQAVPAAGLFHEVLPSIRMTGSYTLPKHQVFPPPAYEHCPFPDWPLEEWRTKLSTVSRYTQAYGVLAGQWIMPQLGFTVPPLETIEHGRRYALTLVQPTT